MADIMTGSLDYSTIGSDFLADFPVGRTGSAAILWLNDRWFLQNGVDSTAGPVRAAIGASLLFTFAVCADVRYCLPHSFGTARLGADRYGAADGTLHGGSGRCGSVGGFHAKGIGPTPLVPGNADWGHAHGFLPLGDAIREAIVGEVAGSELPGGAVPVVAILDAGIRATLDPAGAPERCAIIVRPNVLRIAHLERSIFFGSSGFEGSDQQRDAARVRDTVRWLERNPHGGVPFGIDAVLERTTRQIGACRAHRLWSGRATSDNLTIDGALLDHGCFRALPNWRRADDGMGQAFGTEAADIESFACSVPAALRKYGTAAVERPRVGSIRTRIAAMLDKGFADACVAACGLSPDDGPGQAFARLMANCYRTQQRERYSLADPVRRWQRGDLLFHGHGEARVRMAEIARQAQNEGSASAVAFSHAVSRWTMPRVNLYYHVAKRRVRQLCGRLTGDVGTQRRMVERFIAREVTFGRRLFPDVPAQLIVTAHATDLVSSACAVVHPGSGARTIRLSGPMHQGRLLLFGAWVAHASSAKLADGDRACLTLDVPGDETALPASVDIGGRTIRLPDTCMTFADRLSLAAGGTCA